MSSTENLYTPLLTSLPSDVLRNKSQDDISQSSTTIVLIPNSTPPVSIIPPVKIINEVDPLLNEKRRSTETILITNVSRRLCKRKVLHNRLSTTNDIMCFFGLLGVILMVIENEITFKHDHDKDTYLSWFIRLIITITTVVLVILVFYYHHIDFCLYSVNNCLDHWRVGLTSTKIFLMFFEAFICMIHPIPRYIPFISHFQHDNSTISDSISPSNTAIDVALGVSMFARIYLVCRFAVFHSHFVRNVSSQSLGCLSQVSFDFVFLVKTYLTKWPARCVLVFCTCLLLIGSWSLRACNKSIVENLSMLDSMWLFIVTFTTVGYGDLTPSTYCGRSAAAITALIGVLSTALLISVLAHKLELTRSEKYVHNYVLKNGLAKERKIQAANVIVYAIKLWYLKRTHRSASFEYIKLERRMLRSMHFNQQLKQEQRKLVDNCVGLPELLTIQREVSDKTQENTERLTLMKLKVDRIEGQLADINQTMTNIQNTLTLLLNRILN